MEEIIRSLHPQLATMVHNSDWFCTMLRGFYYLWGVLKVHQLRLLTTKRAFPSRGPADQDIKTSR